MRQHLTAVEAAAAVGRAELSGAAVGARSLFFRPGTVQGGSYTFSVGTAGSATLVFQTVLPALITAREPSRLTLEGGTHNPASPPFDFLARAYLPLLGRMGPQVQVALERRGFYPAGGGRFRAEIAPVERLAPVTLEQRGELRARRGRAIVANLPRVIGAREVAVLAERLKWRTDSFTVETEDDTPGPGNVVIVEVESEALTEIFTGFGEKGVRAETVAERVAVEAEAYLAAGVPVGVHLADQLTLLLALAGGGSFRTLSPTKHTRTQIDVIGRFLGPVIALDEEPGGTWRISARRGG